MFNIDKQSSVECCFGLEAVNWITDNINTVSRSEAVKLLEVCYDTCNNLCGGFLLFAL